MSKLLLSGGRELPKDCWRPVGFEISATAFDMGWEGRGIRTSTRMEVSPDYFFSLEATIEGEEGGVKPEQAELWRRLEE